MKFKSARNSLIIYFCSFFSHIKPMKRKYSGNHAIYMLKCELTATGNSSYSPALYCLWLELAGSWVWLCEVRDQHIDSTQVLEFGRPGKQEHWTAVSLRWKCLFLKHSSNVCSLLEGCHAAEKKISFEQNYKIQGVTNVTGKTKLGPILF